MNKVQRAIVVFLYFRLPSKFEIEFECAIVVCFPVIYIYIYTYIIHTSLKGKLCVEGQAIRCLCSKLMFEEQIYIYTQSTSHGIGKLMFEEQIYIYTQSTSHGIGIQ